MNEKPGKGNTNGESFTLCLTVLTPLQIPGISFIHSLSCTCTLTLLVIRELRRHQPTKGGRNGRQELEYAPLFSGIPSDPSLPDPSSNVSEISGRNWHVRNQQKHQNLYLFNTLLFALRCEMTRARPAGFINATHIELSKVK